MHAYREDGWSASKEIIVKVVQSSVPPAVVYNSNLSPIEVTLEFSDDHPEAGRPETLWSKHNETLLDSDIPRPIQRAFKMEQGPEELKLVYYPDLAQPPMTGEHSFTVKASRRYPALIINYHIQLIIHAKDNSEVQASFE